MGFEVLTQVPCPGQEWEEEPCRARQVLVVAFPQPAFGQVWEYAQDLGRLLETGVSRVETANEIAARCGAGGGPTLVILGSPDHPVLSPLLLNPAEENTLVEQPGSQWAVLVAQPPRWPL